jgi:AraC-like DNA-binding protein
VLRSALRFGCLDSRIVIAQHWLDMPMPAANPNTSRQLAELCRAQMPADQPASGMAARIEQRLALHPAQAPKLAELAAELHMTERTLRRQLLAEGVSYRALLDRVREHSARRLLRDGRLPLVHVAAAVGFADIRDFRRAFKRWTGRLPGELRRSEAAAASLSPAP